MNNLTYDDLIDAGLCERDKLINEIERLKSATAMLEIIKMSITIGRYYIEWNGFCPSVWLYHRSQVGYAFEYLISILFFNFRVLKPTGIRGIVK